MPVRQSDAASSSVDEDAGRLVRKIRVQFEGGGGGLSYSQHAKSCTYLCRLRNCIDRHGPLHHAAKSELVCTGICVWRQSRLGDGTLDEDHAKLLCRTCTLVFTILAMSDMSERLTRFEGEGASTLSMNESAQVEDMLEKANRTTVWELIRPVIIRKSKKGDNAIVEGPEDAEIVDEDEAVSVNTPSEEGSRKRARGLWSWEDVGAGVTAGAIARGLLAQGVRQLKTDVFGPLDNISNNFFHSSSLQLLERLLMPSGNQDFVTLNCESSIRITPSERDERLFNIVQNAESEAGQFVTRDLLLSFWLPTGIVGLRRTLLLSRAASTQAGVEHPEVTQRAHEVAMQGAEWTWKNSKSEAERMSVLLAGVAVMTTRGKAGETDPIRKSDAFGGRVQLPCFETASPESGMRIALVPHAKRWILYCISKSGLPQVLCSQTGFEGLCTCLLKLCE